MLALWNPLSELGKLDDIMRRSWEASPARAAVFRPAVDIVEKDDRFVVSTELPGVKAEDVEVNVDGEVLTISGERRAESDEAKDGYHRIERSYGSFRRSFTLPDTVSRESIEASMTDGVLTLTIPKGPEAKPLKIPVTSAPNGRKAKR